MKTLLLKIWERLRSSFWFVPAGMACLAGVLAFRRAATTVNPTTPQASSSVVTTGIYAHSRNPIYVADAPGFTLAVQWHPEWNAANDPVSRPLFSAFGEAVKAWSGRH